MNEKLSDFLTAQKEIKAKEKLEARNQHLKKLGLTEDDKTPINVTDEEYEEICQYCPPKKPRTMEDNFPILLRKVKSIRRLVIFYVIFTLVIFFAILAIIAAIWIKLHPDEQIIIHL